MVGPGRSELAALVAVRSGLKWHRERREREEGWGRKREEEKKEEREKVDGLFGFSNLNLYFFGCCRTKFCFCVF